MISVKIYEPKPYTSAGGFILADLSNRLMESAKQHNESEASVRNLFTRLWALDPSVLALVALDDSGHVKGHALATIEGDSAYLLQPRVDEPTEEDTIGKFISLVEYWLKVYNSAVIKQGIGIPISHLTLLARRADPKWAKKYGFETRKYLMEKELGE